MKHRRTGKWLISVAAGGTAIGPLGTDWNRTHMRNPNWPAHAKLHGGQTILVGLVTGGLSLGYLWLPEKLERSHLRLAVLFASLYSITQAAAFLFPGTAATDAEHGYRLPRIGGMELNQLHITAGVGVLLLVGYALESKRIEA